ncbi:hypothetical protein GCM10007862_14580 [Dyella lipolytica]|nr:hypothetical protein GCM10007862_14580 [Dyella lipolytica]
MRIFLTPEPPDPNAAMEAPISAAYPPGANRGVVPSPYMSASAGGSAIALGLA